MDLYHWEPNTSALKPLIVLKEKGLPFVSHYVDVLRRDSASLHAFPGNFEVEANLEGEGPVLVHNGAVLSESFFIALYLDEAFPEPALRSETALNHWEILVWGRFVAEVLAPAVSTLGCKRYLVPVLKGRDGESMGLSLMPVQERRDAWFAALNDTYTAEEIEDSRRKVSLSIKRMEDALADSAWLVGAMYSLADIDVFAWVNALPSLVPDLVNPTVSPRTMDWLERIRSRPAVGAALAMSRTGKPEQAFAPGPEHSRWG